MKGSKIFASFVGATMIFTSTIPAYARTLPSYSYQQVMKQAGLKSTELQFDELNDDYEKVDGGIRGHGSGDKFLYSNTEAKNFVYEADVKFNEKKGAASLVFRAHGEYSYVANLNGENGSIRVFKFGDAADLGPSVNVKLKDSNTYHLKVVAIDNLGNRYRIQERLRELEEILPSYFIRINKSSLANEHRILRFDAVFSGSVDAVFECGYREYVSRRCFAEIKRRLGI